MKKYILAIVAILTIGGGGFTYWLGQQPKVTFYQNGQAKTVTPRYFFKEIGEAKFYDENGKLIQKYNVTNGIKDGRSVVYFNDGEIEFDYVGDKISGKVSIETDEEIPEFQNLTIKATEGTLRIKRKRETSSVSLSADITCEQEQFISAVKNYADTRDKKDFIELLRCLRLENIKTDECSVNGSFSYPTFSENTTIKCKESLDVANDTYHLIRSLDVSNDTYRLIMSIGRSGKYANTTEISAKKACSDEQIIDFFIDEPEFSENILISEIGSKIKDFLGCFNFEKVRFQSDKVKCVFKGGFKYPNFTQDSRLVCESDTEFFKEISRLSETERMIFENFLGEILNAKKMRYTIDYLTKNGTIIFNTKTDNQSLNSTISISGWDKIIPETLKSAISAIEDYMSGGDFSDRKLEKIEKTLEYTDLILKNLSLTGINLVVNGKKVSEFSGNLNLFTGFSGTYNSNLYVNDNLIGQLAIKNDGNLIARINHPSSGKPFITLGIKFKDGLQEKYQILAQDLWKLSKKDFLYKLSRHEEEVIKEKISDFAVNAIDSVSILLSDKNEQKVLSAGARLNQGTNFKDIVDIVDNGGEITDVLTFKVASYKNNEVQYVVKNVGKDTLDINGNVSKYPTSELHTILATLFKTQFETLSKETEEEFAQFSEQFESGKLRITGGIGGMTAGFSLVPIISGHSKAMSKFKTNRLIDQVSMIIANIRTLFSTQSSYTGLDNAFAIKSRAVPEEMYELAKTQSNDGRETIIHNAFDGNVVISPSPLNGNDIDNKAFKVTFYGIPQDRCIDIATEDWGYENSGFVGLHIWNAENSDTIKPDAAMDNVYSDSYVRDTSHFFIETPVSISKAINACSCSNRNTCAITWKYR